MLHLAHVIVLLLVGISSINAYSQEKQTIRWLTWEQVPNFILSGKFEGQGLGDAFTRALQLELPEFNHVNISSNTRRYNRLIREPDVCVAWAWIVPGSREYRIHSRPVSLAHPTGIHVLKSKQHLFGRPGQTLSLATLLAKPDITLGYLKEMTYSKKVHDLLDQYQHQGNIHFSSPTAVEFNLEMLDRNRVDYLFGFAAQSTFNAEIKNIPNHYEFYNLEEFGVYTSMHTHCSKTPLGEKVMTQVNQKLTNEMLMEHLAVVERWYGNNRQYREAFIDYVIQQKPHKLVSDPGQ
jgi:uncharacterized protein (TIGR02285 family)